MFYDFLALCCGHINAYGNCKLLDRNNDARQRILLIQKYIDLYVNRFKYNFNGVDELSNYTLQNKLFEFMSFFAPATAIFKDEVLGLQVLPVTGQFKFNMAGYPTEWQVFGMNGYRKKLSDKNSVLIFNDYAFTIPFLQCLYNIDFMVECDNTHKQNLKAQRQPMILELEEDEKKSANDFISKLNSFADTIAVRRRVKDKNKKVNDNPYETRTFESGRNFEGDKLGADYKYFESRILTYIGYNNENIEKRERVLVDEVNANNIIVNSFYTTALKCRQEAWDKANKMFNCNVTVEPNELLNFKGENNGEHISTLQQGQTAKELNS